MNTHSITIRPVDASVLPAVVDLLIAQQTRHFRGDSRLSAALSQEQVKARLVKVEQEEGGNPLVALDAQGQVRGYVVPSLWRIAETSMLRAFLTACNGVALNLTLPDPDEEDALSVADALFGTLTEFWRHNSTSGDLVRWPSWDSWIEPVLREHGFQLDSVCASYPRQQLPSSTRMISWAQGIIRLARPEDEEALVRLLDEELRFHELYTPFVRSTPEVLRAFRRKLARLWNGVSVEEGAPLILVAEREGDIVAMGENTLLILDPDDEPGFTPPGRYACIDNVSVRSDARGQGIGRLLLEAAFDAFTPTSFEEYVLWYNPVNVLAGRVWPHLGFQPLWTTYQRLASHRK